jgi:glycosyltransferase involved in cell wall biosynthesis
MTTLSVIVITKNEQANIRQCLESVKWADEIIILDSGSSDNTVEICKEYTDKVFVTDWPGYGPQKNRALDKATSEWVLSLDADEWLSDELAAEIKQTIQSSPKDDAYCFQLANIYWGKVLKYGNEARDVVLRLFRRGKARFKEVIVHECVVTESTPKKLKHTLFHNCFRDLEQTLNTLNRYSSLNALMRYKAGRRCSFSRAIVSGLWAFFRTYILRRGFLDGKEGFMAAVYCAEGSYYRYLMLWKLSQSSNK